MPAPILNNTNQKLNAPISKTPENTGNSAFFLWAPQKKKFALNTPQARSP